MLLRPALAGLLSAAMIAAAPAIAAAHAELESSSPAAGENLDSPPTEVTLTFGDEIDPDGSSFTVVDADGHQVGSGAADLTVADRNVMTGSVTITEPGVYTIEYTVVASDGDQTSGTVSFGYNAGEDIPDPTSSEAPDTAMPPPALPWATVVGWLLVAASGMLALRRVEGR